MYDVSDEYIAAISSVSVRENLFGTIGNVAFDTSDIVKGSFSLNNQCCGSSTLELGQVYVGELKCTFNGLSISRNSYKGLQVVPWHGVYIEDNEDYENVPLGVYTIDKAEWSESGISITAYDNMSKFDKTFSISSTNGEIYDFLSYVCLRCNVTLGMTQEEVEALPNGTENFDLYEEINDIKTYRDFLSWIAQTTATNALIDRSGNLYLKSYDLNSVDELGTTRRMRSGKVSDFNTYYTGMSIVNIEEKTTSYFCVLPDNGLTYNLGQNPLMQYGLDETKERQRQAIIDSFSVANYVPCDFSLVQAPIYDLMDCVTLSGGIADDSELTCVVKWDWKYGGTYNFECVGQDPSLASVQSKVDKNISGLMESVQTDNSTFYVYGFENSEAYSIGTVEEEATTIDFATVDTSRVVFIFQAQANMTLDGNVVANIYLNNELYETYRMYYPRGHQNIIFAWFHDMTAGQRHELTVGLKYEYFESDRRIDAAHIGTLKNYIDAVVFYMSRQAGTWAAISIYTWDYMSQYKWSEIYDEESSIGYQTWDDVLKGGLKISPSEIKYSEKAIDTTTGLIEIGIGQVKSILFGRGLAATDVWDGTLKLSDSTERVSISSPTVVLPVDSATIGTLVPISHSGLSDTTSTISIPVIDILSTIVDEFINISAESESTTSITIYCVNASDESDVVTIDTSIVSITFNTTQEATFAASNDGGDTWYVWDGTQFVALSESATTYGDAVTMSSVPADSWNAFEVSGLKFKWSAGDDTIIDTIVIEKEASEEEEGD